MLLEALLGADNPMTKWAAKNQGLLGAFGAGLAQGPDLSTGIARGLTYAPKAKLADQVFAAEQEEKAKEQAQNDAFKGWLQQNRPDLAPLLEAGVGRGELFNQAMKPQGGDASTLMQNATDRAALGQQYGLSGQDLTQFVLTGELPSGRGAAAEVSLQPTWMIGPDGKPTLGQITKGGEVIQTQLPQGMSIMDPAALAGGRAGATVDAKTAANARAALPSAKIQTDTTLAAIDRVVNNEAGMKEWFSQVGPRGVYVHPGSAMGNWVADFSQADNQAFLQARQFLKGQGAITEMESAKAEGAYSRMAAAKATGDERTFREAAGDFRQAVIDGYRKLGETAAGAYSQGAPGAPTMANSGNGWTVLGVE